MYFLGPLLTVAFSCRSVSADDRLRDRVTTWPCHNVLTKETVRPPPYNTECTSPQATSCCHSTYQDHFLSHPTLLNAWLVLVSALASKETRDTMFGRLHGRGGTTRPTIKRSKKKSFPQSSPALEVLAISEPWLLPRPGRVCIVTRLHLYTPVTPSRGVNWGSDLVSVPHGYRVFFFESKRQAQHPPHSYTLFYNIFFSCI